MRFLKYVTASIFLLSTNAIADISISKLELGGSVESFQNLLRSEEFIFTDFSQKKIVAQKLAFVGSDQREGAFYPNSSFIPSTNITANLCNGKIFKITYKSLFSLSLENLLMARKEIYQHLKDNSATLSSFNLSQGETSVKVVNKFVIDRNAIAGPIKGEEVISFAIDVNKQFVPNQSNQPYLDMDIRIENRWFCPD